MENDQMRQIPEQEQRSTHDVVSGTDRDRLTGRQRRRDRLMAAFDAEHAVLLDKLAQ